MIDAAERAELDTRFDYHQPGAAEQSLMASFRVDIKNLAIDITETVKPSREVSLALTHLEQAQLYINAAIARRGLRTVTPRADGTK